MIAGDLSLVLSRWRLLADRYDAWADHERAVGDTVRAAELEAVSVDYRDAADRLEYGEWS